MAIMSLDMASETKVGCPLSWITTFVAAPPVARQSARHRSQKSSKPDFLVSSENMFDDTDRLTILECSSEVQLVWCV